MRATYLVIALTYFFAECRSTKVFSSKLTKGTIIKKCEKYKTVLIWPNSINGVSTCLAPICINIKKLATKIKKAILLKGLYGTFERLPLLGAFASSSIVLSAAYTMYMFNRIAFAGSYSRFFKFNIPDLNKREFVILLTLVAFTVVLGVYPAPILDGLHYSVSLLIYHA